ncbi:uncharacterized protein PRCAT00001646001 [Priceomyces carsonii]|uniref:uncharacterized protein n=1 Tax=Priceomyces carsonii TaxID=28549 RepID=UPI002ED83B82|nr:unnamed protein product [Priceomyces carsonii]
MSSRALKRLENQKVEENKESDLGSGDWEKQGFIHEPKLSFNAFSILNDDGEDEQSGSEREEVETKNLFNTSKESDSFKKSNRSKGKNKGKHRKPKNTKKKGDSDSDEEFLKNLIEAREKDDNKSKNVTNINASSNDMYNFEEELDLIIEPQQHYDSNFKYFTSNRAKQSLPLLSVKSLKDFDPDSELKNLFGNLSAETIEDANRTTSLSISPNVLLQYKKLAKLTRGWGGRDHKSVPGTSRKLLLTKIKDDWLPTSQRPMTMEEIKFDELVKYFLYKEDTFEISEIESKIEKELHLGVKYFKFKRNDTIQAKVANSKFYASVVMTPDPESLMTLLQQYPYHAETLLQVAMVLLRNGSDKVASHALTEKCLFVFDWSFHKNFHELLAEGKSGLIRLPYEVFLNRQFYLCLFRYITILGERSTYFTAFSFCRFLLALSPAEDPLGVRYFIDFYAILGEQYEFLIKFVDSPLITTYDKWFTPGLAFSRSLAFLYLNEREKASGALKTAFMKYPILALKLFESIGSSRDIHITEKDIPVTDESILASETYMVRAGMLWKDPQHKQFLHDELKKLFDNPDLMPTKKGIASSLASFFGAQRQGPQSEEIPYNLIRFAILSGESKIMAKLPKKVWSFENLYEYDVLPPKDAGRSYDEFNGLGTNENSVTDSLLDHIDQGVIGSILERRTEEDDFAEIIRQLQLQDAEDPGVHQG